MIGTTAQQPPTTDARHVLSPPTKISLLRSGCSERSCSLTPAALPARSAKCYAMHLHATPAKPYSILMTSSIWLPMIAALVPSCCVGSTRAPGGLGLCCIPAPAAMYSVAVVNPPCRIPHKPVNVRGEHLDSSNKTHVVLHLRTGNRVLNDRARSRLRVRTYTVHRFHVFICSRGLVYSVKGFVSLEVGTPLAGNWIIYLFLNHFYVIVRF